MSEHDPAERRHSQRYGRERGRWVYLPQQVLSAAGVDTRGPAPWYRTWAAQRSRGSVLVRLYRTKGAQ